MANCTDKEKFQQLMDSFGVPLIEENYNDSDFLNISEFNSMNCSKIDGYSGFETRFKFDKQGSFISVGLWE